MTNLFLRLSRRIKVSCFRNILELTYVFLLDLLFSFQGTSPIYSKASCFLNHIAFTLQLFAVRRFLHLLANLVKHFFSLTFSILFVSIALSFVSSDADNNGISQKVNTENFTFCVFLLKSFKINVLLD